MTTIADEYRVMKKGSAYELGEVLWDGSWNCEIWFASLNALKEFVIRQRSAIDRPILEERDGKLVEVEE